MNDEQKPEQQTNWQYNAGNPSTAYAGDGMSVSTGVPLPQVPAVEWTASEYVAHEKSPSWYSTLGVGSGILIVAVYFITQDFMASVVILLSCVAIGIYAARQPATKNYRIDEKGVQVEDKFHPYMEFRSFSVVEEGAIDSVWIKPLKRFAPIVVMYFSPEDEQEIINTLANFLPQEVRELDAVDKLTRRLRF